MCVERNQQAKSYRKKFFIGVKIFALAKKQFYLRPYKEF